MRNWNIHQNVSSCVISISTTVLKLITPPLGQPFPQTGFFDIFRGRLIVFDLFQKRGVLALVFLRLRVPDFPQVTHHLLPDRFLHAQVTLQRFVFMFRAIIIAGIVQDQARTFLVWISGRHVPQVTDISNPSFVHGSHFSS